MFVSFTVRGSEKQGGAEIKKDGYPKMRNIPKRKTRVRKGFTTMASPLSKNLKESPNDWNDLV
jgi:hypothetical protein